jgi:hypothetical protein
MIARQYELALKITIFGGMTVCRIPPLDTTMKVNIFTTVFLVFFIGVCLTAIDIKGLFEGEDAALEVASHEVR